jgi:hypothetical protein
MPDIADFVSPVDRTLVHGRASLREHNKRNNVTNAADFKQTWAKQAQERAKFYERAPDPTRKEDLRQAVDNYQRNRK